MTPTTHQWNLRDLYSGLDDPQINKDKTKCHALVEELTTYRGTIENLSSKELYDLIQKQEALTIVMHKLHTYPHLLMSTNSGVDTVTRFQKQITEFSTGLQKQILFIDVELARLTEKQWQTHKQAPELQDYRLVVEHYAREAKHTLTEPEEKILADKSQTSWQTLQHLFDVTTDTLTIPWEGKNETLSNVIAKLHAPDQAVRKQAAVAIHTALQTNDKTTPAIYNALVHDKQITDTLRHYDYPEEARLESDDVDLPTVNALISTVNNSNQLVANYYHLKKEILGEKELYWWDRYAPLPKPQKTLSIDEAKQLVLDAFGEFSPTFRTIAETMFEKEHLDWLPSETKQGGAFCAFGAKGTYPYILLNFTGQLNDVMTLAHELGHAIHDVLAQENNAFLNAWPSLAQAEIASTFAEELLFNKLLHDPTTSKEDQKALLMDHIEGAIATTHRQIAMFQFEQAIHHDRRKKGELSKDEIDTLWHEKIKAPFGDSLIWTDEHKNFWMYVSHVIQSPFYVYSYAFAQLCTLALVHKYKTSSSEKQRADFTQTYLHLLKAGGSLTPKDNLAQAGLDITTPEFWRHGLQLIEDDLRALEKLMESA